MFLGGSGEILPTGLHTASQSRKQPADLGLFARLRSKSNVAGGNEDKMSVRKLADYKVVC